MILKRFSSSLLLSLLLIGSVLPTAPAEAAQTIIQEIDRANARDAVSRARFLGWSVEFLYGSDFSQEYSVPFTGVPAQYRSAIGLAYTVGALDPLGIERSGSTIDWDRPITRCQGLESLFAIARLTPHASGEAVYRDVRSGTTARIVEQAVSWRLIEPLTARHFGCNRPLRFGDFSTMLNGISGAIQNPLTPPTPRKVTPSRVRRQRQTTPTRTRTRGRDDIPTVRLDLSGSSVSKSSKGPGLEKLQTIWNLVRQKFIYLDKVDQDELAHALAQRMVESLEDKHAAYLRPKSAENFRSRYEGEITGIGARVELHEQGGIRIVTPLNDTPAMAAGIRAGDRITEVDGKSIIGLDLQQAVDLIRGPINSTVTLLIEREGGTLSKKIVRAKIAIRESDTSIQDNVSVIKLFQFGFHAQEELEEALLEATTKDVDGVVLDLRNNPGGLLDAARDVLGHFLPQNSVIARIQTKGDVREERTRRARPTLPEDIPIVVLVNKGSASASEIVAGALQDYDRARVVGTTTFGKGSVQEVNNFGDGSAVKMTIATYQTPSGSPVDERGITPDVIIEELEGGRDEVLLEGIRLVKDARR